MQMDEDQRLFFGAALTALRTSRFGGSRKAAYTAAGVNSATWRRAEQGQTLKEHTLATIVGNLFPGTGGDWTRLLHPGSRDLSVLAMDVGVPASTQDDRYYVSGPGEKVEGGDSEGNVLRAIEQVRQDVLAMERRMSQRLDRLEDGDRLEGPGA